MNNLIKIGLLAVMLGGCATTSSVGYVAFGTGVDHEWGTGGEVWSHFSSYSMDNVNSSANGYCTKRGLGAPNIKLTNSPSGGSSEYYKYTFECSKQTTAYNSATAPQTFSGAEAKQVDEGVAAYKRGDYATALKIFLPLAVQGNAVAQNNLGVMYADGNGVPKDNAEAAKWYQLAANQGLAKAQENLSKNLTATVSRVQSYSTGGGYDPKAEDKPQQATTNTSPPISTPQPVQTYTPPTSYQPRNDDERQCLSFGFTPNSDGFGNCMLQLSQVKNEQIAYERAVKERERQAWSRVAACGAETAQTGRPCSGGSNAPAPRQPAPRTFMSPRGFVNCDHVGSGYYNCHGNW